MAHEHLAIYLNDHLAGSVVALELLERLEETHGRDGLGDFFKLLRADIASDRQDLEQLMEELKIDQSRTRKASAWVAEKFTELKLRFDDPQAGVLLLFESLEALSLGIEGKHSLWTALAAAGIESSLVKLADYERLKQRAKDQRDRVEQLRITNALTALAPP
jgi:hypothetical protein